MQWEPDRGLQVRMALSTLLVLVLPVAFVAAMLLIGLVLAPELFIFVLEAVPGGGFGLVPLGVVVAVLAGLSLQYLAGDRLVLRSVGAVTVTTEERPVLHAAVGRLAQQVDLPKPSVAIVNSSVPNAFTVGHSPASSTVVVTTGLGETLGDAEIEAVLAHELAHVRNRDGAIMTVASLLPTLTYFLAMMAYHFLGAVWSIIASAFGSLRRVKGLPALLFIAVIFVVTSVLTMAVSAFFWVGSFLIYRLLSRYREYAADRGAAQITGNPLALATALEKIDGRMETLPDRDLRELDGGVEALYVSPLDAPMFTDDEGGLLSRDIFPESHPPTSERIDRLREIAAKFERT